MKTVVVRKSVLILAFGWAFGPLIQERASVARVAHDITSQEASDRDSNFALELAQEWLQYGWQIKMDQSRPAWTKMVQIGIALAYQWDKMITHLTLTPDKLVLGNCMCFVRMKEKF